jgi:ribulose-phosphate 3-epimerase
MTEPRILASILSADFARYVPNLTVGPLVCRSLREYGIQAPMDVHLMVTPVDELILPFAQAGANFISFHPDATIHVDRTLSLIRSQGVKAGLAFNPASSLDILDYVIDKVDMILLMSVNPGFGGQHFIPATLQKIAKARSRIAHANHEILLSVDGGINPKTIGAVARAGADSFVVGSALFGSEDFSATILNLRHAYHEQS